MPRRYKMKSLFFAIPLVIAGSAFVSGVSTSPAYAQTTRDLSNRISRLENEIQTLSRAIFRGEQPPASAYADNPEQAANIEIRLQQMETELRKLTGMIEQQNHEVSQIRQDMERRVSDLEVRMGGGAVSRPPVSNNATFYDSKPPAEDNYRAPAPIAGGKPLGTFSPSPSNGDPGAALYESAFALLKAGQYDPAEAKFAAFLQQYPDHILAGNAKYWQGETFYVRGNYERAARIFAEGYQRYPEGPKAADNLLKLGMSLAGIGNKDDACVALAQLEKDFPSGSGPVLRRARQEMERLGCY